MRTPFGTLFAVAAIASGTAGLTSRAAADPCVWALAGREVLRIHAGAAGLTPQKRVEALDERMNEILSKCEGSIAAAEIVISTESKVVRILVRGELLITATAADAAANHTTPDRLARTWLSALRKTIPQITPRPNEHGP